MTVLAWHLLVSTFDVADCALRILSTTPQVSPIGRLFALDAIVCKLGRQLPILWSLLELG